MDLYFMPSDIARLILGYLKENSYSKTYHCFLKECIHLKELYSLEKAGISLKKVTQLSLVTIVEEWGRFKYSNDRSNEGSNKTLEVPSSDDTVDDNDVISSGRKAKHRPRSSNKKSPCASRAGRSPRTPKSQRTKSKSPGKALSKSIESLQNSKDNGSHAADGEGSVLARATDNCIQTECTPEKVPEQTEQVEARGISNVGVTSTSNINISQFNISECAEIRKRNVSSVASDNCIKSPKHSSSHHGAALSDDVYNKKTESQKEINNKPLSEHVFSEKNSELKNKEVSAQDHKNPQDVNVNTNNFTDVETRTGKQTIHSETSAERVVEPPLEGVKSVEDKCMSWMNKNENTCTSGDSEGNKGKITDGTEDVTDKPDIVGKSAILQQLNMEQAASQHAGKRDVESTKTSSDPGSSNSSSQESSKPLHVTPKKTDISASTRGHVTPIKSRHISEHNTSKSPRRKKPKTPRKRANDVSPVSVISTKSVDPANVHPIFEKILSDRRLHEKLAETCNLVHSQIKLATSGKEKSDPSLHAGEHDPTVLSQPDLHETATASKSLEEILGFDNFHTDLLSDNIDMSDPAYESMFKLFGTDRETFVEYLRKEKDKELALMEAEVEELERSNHEILCANFGMSQADAGYETQELAYRSPHPLPLSSQQDLFVTQQALHSPRASHVTSTPCGTGAPVNFTPLLRGNELGNSPVHSVSGVFGGARNTVTEKTSPCSTATQPFSPTSSHYSEVNNPPTPQHQRYLSTHCHGNSPAGPHTPTYQHLDHYSNPATPQQASPQHNQLLHSTPTGSVRSLANSDHFHQSSPIHHQHPAMSNIHIPANCSPLVKADLNPHSPYATQNHNTGFQSASNGLYFNSPSLSRNTGHEYQNFQMNRNNTTLTNIVTEQSVGYLNFLNENSNLGAAAGDHCSTIENSIGCISLPQPTALASKTKSPEKKSNARKSRRKKAPVKRKESFLHLKQMLNKPLSIPNSVLLTMKAPGLPLLPRTPEKKVPHEANLTFRSPGGKTMINVPVLNCEDEIDLSILGIDDNGDSAEIVNVYDQNLDASTQYAIDPENQATHGLVNALQAGNTEEAVKQIKEKKKESNKGTKKSQSDRRSRSRRKKEVLEEEQEENFDPTPPSIEHNALQDGYLDPNEIYTATPDTSVGKAATARALDFGPEFRKIMPKPPETGPSVLILSSNQVITPGNQIVVSSTPVTVVPTVLNTSTSTVNNKDNSNRNSEVVEINEKENVPTVKIIRMSSESASKYVDKASDLKINTEGNKINTKENKIMKTPLKSDQRNKKYEQSPHEEVLSKSKTVSSSSEKENKSLDSSDLKQIQTRRSSRNLTDISSEKVESARVSLTERLQLDENKIAITQNNVTSPQDKKLQKRTGKKGDTETNSKKTNKNSKNKSETLKVKLPLNQKSRKCNAKSNMLISENPFTSKNKTDKSSSSDENIPLSELKKQAKSSSKKKTAPENICVAIVTDSESDDEESVSNGEIMQQLTPKKITEVNVSDEDRTPSKAVLLEKIGLTPKKLHVEQEFKSPSRTNVLDVLAELQSSPVSSRCTRARSEKKSTLEAPLKSPTTPRRRGHAKQLFSSPDNHPVTMTTQDNKRSRHTAKRVDGIIDRLNQNNPKRSLVGSVQSQGQNNITGENDTRPEHKERRRSKSKHRERRRKNRSSTGQIGDNITSVPGTDISNLQSEAQVSDLTCGVQNSEIENENPLAIESIKEEKLNNITNIERSELVSENSQDAHELDRAIASIEFTEPGSWFETHQSCSDESRIKFNVIRDTGKDSDRNLTENDIQRLSERNNKVKYLNGQESSESAEFEKRVKQTDSVDHNRFVVTAEVYRPIDSPVIGESGSTVMVQNVVTENVNQELQINNELENPVSDYQRVNNLTDGNIDNVTETPVTMLNKNDNSETEHRRKSKKKKHKHKHRHHRKSEGEGHHKLEGEGHHKQEGEGYHKHEGEGDNITTESDHHRRHKRKKSKKRRREEGDDHREHKRRRKDKANRSSEMESLAAIDIDEAITKIYGT